MQAKPDAGQVGVKCQRIKTCFHRFPHLLGKPEHAKRPWRRFPRDKGVGIKVIENNFAPCGGNRGYVPQSRKNFITGEVIGNSEPAEQCRQQGVVRGY